MPICGSTFTSKKASNMTQMKDNIKVEGMLFLLIIHDKIIDLYVSMMENLCHLIGYL